MRICLHTIFCIEQNFIGGTERFLIDLSKELSALGHKPFIVCSSMSKRTEIEGIEVFGRIPEYVQPAFNKYSFFSSNFLKKEIIGAPYSLDSLKRISKYTTAQLSEFKADIFHLNSFVSATFFTPNGACIVTNHENDREYNSYWGEGFFEFMADHVKHRRTNLHELDGLLTPSRYYAELFSKNFDLPIRGINLGVNLNNFMIDVPDDSLKKDYVDSSDEALILFPSRFQMKQKGHDVALKAASILKTEGFKFKILFTGLKQSCEKYIPQFDELLHKYDVADCVHITRFSKIQKAYNNCDIVVSPEKYCSYGLSISESLALGIPTVLSDIPTYKEIATGFPHAFFFESESAESLADSIKKALAQGAKDYREEAVAFRIKYDLRQCAREYSAEYYRANQNKTSV